MSKSRIHTVKKGETLVSIAEKNQLTSWEVIYYSKGNTKLREKRCNPNLITPGDKVYIPPNLIEIAKKELNRLELKRDQLREDLKAIENEEKRIKRFTKKVDNLSERLIKTANTIKKAKCLHKNMKKALLAEIENTKDAVIEKVRKPFYNKFIEWIREKEDLNEVERLLDAAYETYEKIQKPSFWGKQATQALSGEDIDKVVREMRNSSAHITKVLFTVESEIEHIEKNLNKLYKEAFEKPFRPEVHVSHIFHKTTLKKNIKLFQFKKRTLRDYFVVANLIYENVKRYKLYNALELWCIDVLDENDTSGYYGASFLDLRKINLDGKNDFTQIIIAHRGTEPSANWFKDIRSPDLKIFLGKLPENQYKSAKRLIERTNIKLGINNDNSNKIKTVHVGHSLGGALAKIAAHDLNDYSVSFEPPGMRKILKDIHPEIDPDRFISINADQSIISSYGSQVGISYYCDFDFPLESPKEIKLDDIWSIRKLVGVIKHGFGSIKYVYDNLSSLHSLKNFQRTFDSDGYIKGFREIGNEYFLFSEPEDSIGKPQK